MKIAIGSDHVGFPLKQHITQYLKEKGHVVTDLGTDGTERVDYPVYGKKVAKEVASGAVDRGILICGTGVGISIAANKVHGIRAVVCSEPYSARLARQHNNANIVAFGGRVVGESIAEMIVDEFLATEYEGGRHQKRIDMISEIEKEE
jgi:ribose 5-phosphate isomerase B